jgi:N utilization substance protein A
MAAIPGVGGENAAILFEQGWRSLRALAVADAEELAEVMGDVGESERIIEVANDAASGKLTLEVRYPTDEELAAEDAEPVEPVVEV